MGAIWCLLLYTKDLTRNLLGRAILLMTFKIPEELVGIDFSEYEFTGLASLKGNRVFYCWWRLIIDSEWKELYEQTGVLKDRCKEKYQKTMNRLLTNLYKSDGEPIIYLRHQDNYSRGTFYYNEKLSYRIIKKCIDALEKFDLIQQGVGALIHDAKYSYFQATDKLQDIFNGLNVKNSNISYELKRTVYLREEKQTQGESGKYLPVDYTKTHNSRLNKLMVKYNSFIKGFDISWEATREARLLHKCLNWKDEPDLIEKRSLYCIFNGNMSNGGRMYGGFWINMPKVLRPFLRIQGEALTDIDFNACHIQILYKGIKESIPKNPYVYTKETDRRDVAKKLLLTTLNYKKKKGRSIGQIRRGVIAASKVQKEFYVEYETAKEILLELEELHTQIKEYFYTGVGLRLQKEEAGYMRKIMKACMKKKILILPCHDGCSVKISQADTVEEIFRGVTEIKFSRGDLEEDTEKIKRKIRKWIKGNTEDKRIEDIKEEFKGLR